MEAVARAVEILKQSRAPLVCTKGDCGVDTQRAAIEFAEAIGGTFDPIGSALHKAATLAFQTVGQSSATFRRTPQPGRSVSVLAKRSSRFASSVFRAIRRRTGNLCARRASRSANHCGRR